MSVVARIIGTAERVPLPDVLIRAAIRRLCGLTAARFAAGDPVSDAAFADAVAARGGEHGNGANARHEVPAEFFGLVLGPNRKYSSCFYKEPASTLREAEEEALRQTVEHADLADGQSILELGCGWGSLSLWMARLFPRAEIVAISSSPVQRQYVETQAAERGLGNLRVVNCDIDSLDPDVRFDRIVSVEMFAHVMKWREEMARVRSRLAPNGRFFMHVFSHRAGSYLFDRDDPVDWIARHFFADGMMPSHHLIGQYADLFSVEKEWRWSGTHYQRTAMQWVANFDANRAAIEAVLRPIYRHETALWMRRWRRLFLATEGLFGFADGEEWGVSHYRMVPVYGISEAVGGNTEHSRNIFPGDRAKLG